MPIYQIGASVFATCLVHQGIRHGYTGGTPDVAGYGGGLEAVKIEQPRRIFATRGKLSNQFPAPWTLTRPGPVRLEEDYLELYDPGDTARPIQTIPFFLYVKGENMDLTYDLWFSRDQLSLDADEVRLSTYTFGADDALGQEVVAGEYLQAKLSTSPNFEPLSSGTFLSLGSFVANSKKILNLRLNIPPAASSKGLIILGLKIEALRSLIYGRGIYGTSIYGAQEKENIGTLMAMIHIFAKA